MHRSDRTTKSLETLCGARTTRSVQFKRCAVIKQVRRYRHHYYINTILKYYSRQRFDQIAIKNPVTLRDSSSDYN